MSNNDVFEYDGYTARHITQHMSPELGRAVAEVLSASRKVRGMGAEPHLQAALKATVKPEKAQAGTYKAYMAVCVVSRHLHPSYSMAVWALFHADSLHTDTAINVAYRKVADLQELAKRGLP